MLRWLTRVLVPLLLVLMVLGSYRWADQLRQQFARGTLVVADGDFTVHLTPIGRRTDAPVGAARRIEGRDGRATLGARRYLLQGWSVTRRDAQGRVWSAERAPGEPPRLLEVKPDGETALSLASPIEPTLVMEQLPDSVVFRLRLKGAAGEALAPLRIDGQPAPPPALRIQDAADRTVARLRFEGDGSTGFTVRWRPPAGATQPMRAVPEVDLGPFKSKPVAIPPPFVNGRS